MSVALHIVNWWERTAAIAARVNPLMPVSFRNNDHVDIRGGGEERWESQQFMVCRSATAGSTREARIAGIAAAIDATTMTDRAAAERAPIL